MTRPVIAVENLFNTRQFVGHAIDANEEASGFQFAHVNSGRRSGLTFWTTTTAHNAAWGRSIFDRVRWVDYLALDRGHNLGGKTLTLKLTLDATDFSGSFESLSFTIPSVSSPGSVDDPNGVTTEEGVWFVRFPGRVAIATRLDIPALGAGIKPIVPGLYCGSSLGTEFFGLPSEEEGDELQVMETETDAGWVGRSRAVQRRSGVITYRLRSLLAYDQIRLHLQGYFGAGHLMWLIHNREQAERAILVQRPRARLAFGYQPGWGYKQGQIPWQEYEPLEVVP
jgi:hypothetical protein